MKKIKKIFSKKVIIIVIILIVVGVVGYSIFGGDNGPEYILSEVSYGSVVKEVSETGMVKISEQADLGFRNAGKLSDIFVKVGDNVTTGQQLAKLDTSQLYIELSEAQATLDVANADYSQLLAGSSEEEIKIVETDITNAQLVLDNSKQTLENVKSSAEEGLNQAYEDALDELDSAYLDIYNALIAVRALESKYFSGSDQESIAIRNSISTIQNALNQSKTYIDSAKVDFDRNKIELALSKTKDSLSSSRLALANVRNTTESGAYSVTSADKTIIDNQRTYVNTAHEDIVSAQQVIATAKIANSTNISDATASVASAEIALQKKEDELALKKAGPTQEAINLYLAKIKQAQSKVSLLNNKISEAVLKSPIDGQVLKINKRKGETVQPTDSVVVFLPSGPFQVEVDIYEEDIVDVQANNYVKVMLPAFSDDIFDGRVISIDPAEKLIDGVVYYEVNISFKIGGQNIKPGMTADVVIETNKKENVLTAPTEAIEKRDGVKMAKVYIGKQLVYREVELGLEGEDNIEIISGLSEGEQVIIGEKQK